MCKKQYKPPISNSKISNQHKVYFYIQRNQRRSYKWIFSIPIWSWSTVINKATTPHLTFAAECKSNKTKEPLLITLDIWTQYTLRLLRCDIYLDIEEASSVPPQRALTLINICCFKDITHGQLDWTTATTEPTTYEVDCQPKKHNKSVFSGRPWYYFLCLLSLQNSPCVMCLFFN